MCPNRICLRLVCVDFVAFLFYFFSSSLLLSLFVCCCVSFGSILLIEVQDDLSITSDFFSLNISNFYSCLSVPLLSFRVWKSACSTEKERFWTGWDDSREVQLVAAGELISYRLAFSSIVITIDHRLSIIVYSDLLLSLILLFPVGHSFSWTTLKTEIK